MPQRIFLVVVVLIFLPFGEILGQQKNVEKIPLHTQYQASSLANCQLYEQVGSVKKNPINPAVQQFQSGHLLLTANAFYHLNYLPGNYYCDNLSFFCRKEYQFEKTTRVSLRFRLGSLEYTDYLEKKPNAQKR